MNSLSSLDRDKVLSKLATKTFDLVIIGGGITGAGIALDAASRGLKVALIEKDDFAAGTSSKSTKLIHGGLRYLKQLEINLVREVGRERAIVHKLAPHLVSAEKMLLPIIKDGTYSGLATSVGLWVYDVLAGVEGDDKRKMLSKKKTVEKEPLLRKDILEGGGFYAEYRTDDARLTIENIKTATSYGAICINYVKGVDFIYENDRITGVKCKDQIKEDSFSISTRFVISAAGPWVDKIRRVNKSLSGKHIFHSKGVHIVVPHQRFPIKHSVYFDIPDGRMLFAIPRHRSTYIGTTDTPFKGDINNIPVDLSDVNYLLEGVNHMFPSLKLAVEDIESSWAGVRPLIYEEGKSASEMSRKDEIFESETGLISIAGGKLTGFRKMAERVVDVVVKKYNDQYDKKLGKSFTKEIPLGGNPFKSAKSVAKYRKKVEKHISGFGLSSYYATYLVANYGKQSKIILEQLQSYNDPAEIALARAETWYAIHHEIALKPLDFFNRRTGRLYFNRPSIPGILDAVMKDFQSYFEWSDKKLGKEREIVLEAIHHVTNFEAVPATDKDPTITKSA